MSEDNVTEASGVITTVAVVPKVETKSELASLRDEMISLRESIEKLSALASAAYRRR